MGGVGRATITPPVGMPMGGWSNAVHERSEGNDLELTCSALVMTDGAAALAICELDLCLVTDAQARAMREAVSSATGIPVEAVRVTATHNHSAPVTGELTGAGWMREGLDQVDRYVTMVTEQLAGAARAAWESMVPISVGHGRGSSPLGVNRRVALPGGGIRVGHNWEGPVDHTVRVTRIDAQDGNALATILHYSAHPTILAGGNRYINPEYPGAARRVVEAAVGGRCLFLQGTPGDVGPVETFVSELEPYRRLGAMLGHDAAATALRSSANPRRQRLAEHQEPSTWLTAYEYEPVDPTDPVLTTKQRVVEMPVRPDLGSAAEWRAEQRRLRSELEAAIDRAADPLEIRELRVRTKAASMRAERAEALDGLSHYPLEIHGARIGDVAFVGVPLEPFIDLGRAVEASSPFAMTLVSGYTNGYRNYLPTMSEWERGGYEVDICAFPPEAADLFVDGAREVLQAMAG
jgi:hypothetical protein